MPIAALVDRVLDESGYEAALLGEFLGSRKRANARKLVRLARRFDGQGGFTLADFVARLRDDLRRPPREEQAATTDEEGESVRLMSIHQSKGLEFPIVVIPDLNRDSGSNFQGVVFHPELGPLVRPSRDREPDAGASEAHDASDEQGQSLGWQTYGALEAREEKDEALRLFYVAATRARDALILSAGMRPSEKAEVPRDDAARRAIRPDERTLHRRLAGRMGGPRDPGHAGMPPPVGRRSLQASESPPPPGDRAGDRAIGRPAGCRSRDGEETSAIRGPRSRLVLVPLVGAAGPPDPRDPGRPEGLRAATPRRRRGQGRSEARPGRLRPADRRGGRAPRGPGWRDRWPRRLARAAEIHRAVKWTVAWPPDAAEPIVFQGQMDFLARDRRGEGRVVLVSDPAAGEATERLRLLLSVHAAHAMGLGPVRQAWWVRLGPGGSLHGEERFDPAAIEEAISRL